MIGQLPLSAQVRDASRWVNKFRSLQPAVRLPQCLNAQVASAAREVAKEDFGKLGERPRHAKQQHIERRHRASALFERIANISLSLCCRWCAALLHWSHQSVAKLCTPKCQGATKCSSKHRLFVQGRSCLCASCHEYATSGGCRLKLVLRISVHRPVASNLPGIRPAATQ